jgi:hypothetical protein
MNKEIYDMVPNKGMLLIEIYNPIEDIEYKTVKRWFKKPEIIKAVLTRATVISQGAAQFFPDGQTIPPLAIRGEDVILKASITLSASRVDFKSPNVMCVAEKDILCVIKPDTEKG